MCGLPGNVSSVSDDWLEHFSQTYPLRDMLCNSETWEHIDLDAIKKMFPHRVEAYCVIAFVMAARDSGHWAGATCAYPDRLAVGGLAQDHLSIAWKRLRRWIVSFGTSKELTRSDVIALFSLGFVHIFWGSMKGLIAKGYVHVEEQELEDYNPDMEVFFPTPLLIAKINSL